MPQPAILAAVLDHLWQSTLLALAIGLLVLALRHAPAAIRHGLWLAASIKFVIPFAALAALGRLLAPAGLIQVPAAPATALLQQAAQPLSRFPFASAAPLLRAPSGPARLPPAEAGPPVEQALHHAAFHLDLGRILLIVWALGCCAVLVRWMVRAARVQAMVRAATRLAWPAPMPVVASPSPIGPGLVGLWRPVLVMPRTLPEHLTRSEIDAIVAHEACHLRRRDNLTAALHALIEALFWFHPLVWWIGTRLIAERELACDEAVLRAGHDRMAYARSLVESARLYVQSPLSCVAGASGVDLKSRVEKIMTAPIVAPLSRSKKALLLAAASFAFATPVAAGLLTPEGQKAVAPFAKAMAAISAPARALGLGGTAVDQTSKPVLLARNDVVLAPTTTVGATDAAPLALARTVAAPRVDQPAASQSDRPILVAVATPPAPVARTLEVTDPPEGAASFVQSYAAVTAKRAIARWVRPICVQVVGLPQEQAAEVKVRIEAVAKSVGVKSDRDGCAANVQVDFTADAQQTLDSLFKAGGEALSDATSGTLSVRTMTLPIQAWYLTNGKDLALNDAGDLKAFANYRPARSAGLLVPVVYQGYPFPGDPTASSNMGISNSSPGSGIYSGPSEPGSWSRGPSRPSVMDRSRQFSNVFVIVDVKRIPHAKLGPVGDYVAMLALSQPKALGECQALPSITDLFAACGRPSADGLTAADTAYLHALYGADHTIWAVGRTAVASDVAKVMASRLVDAKVAAR